MPAFSGAYPYLAATDQISAVGENRIGNDGGADSSQWAGKQYTAQYTGSGMLSGDYEQQTLTITAKPYPRVYNIGVYSNNRNATEGFWIKDLLIFMDTPYAISPYHTINNQNVFGTVTAKVGNVFTKRTKRLGGRIF